MTEVKIPFTKKSIRKISASELAPGTKGLELQVQTDFHMYSLCSLEKAHGGPIQDSLSKKLLLFLRMMPKRPIMMLF